LDLLQGDGWVLQQMDGENGQLTVASPQQYSQMQRTHYDAVAGEGTEQAKRAVHPNYEVAQQEARFTLAFILREFGDRQGVCRGATIDEIKNRISNVGARPKLFDFGCGVGRLMEACVASGYQVDGVDISAEMLKIAGESPGLKQAGSRFFLGSGNDCGAAPASEYDIVYSLLCFQHICVRTIRRSILQSMRDRLTDRGMVYVQTQFYPQTRSSDVPPPHCVWDKDNTAAESSNSGADAWVTPDQLGEVYQDFASLFADVRMQFINLPGETNAGHSMEHVVISGSKSPSLHQRVYRSA
jgi:2-polyprenyl-3-methyl-5-hydroxy-6-metoxy-1,4-benzoquinol methylase